MFFLNLNSKMNNVIIDSVTTSEFVMDYATFGNGEQAFVLLPGLSLLPVTPMAKAVAMQYRKFHKDYKVYLFDRKRDVKMGYSIAQMAQDTATAMRSLGIKNAHIMGCSQGGMIAQIIAANHPELVSKLVLCCTAAAPSKMAEKVLGNWIKLAQEGDVVKLNRDVFSHIYSAAFYEKNAQSFALAENLGSEQDLKRFIALGSACQDYDSRELLAHIQCPTLVVGSNIDNVLSGESSIELAQALQCKLIMYDEYGHAAFDEAPDLHDHLLEFFQER